MFTRQMIKIGLILLGLILFVTACTDLSTLDTAEVQTAIEEVLSEAGMVQETGEAGAETAVAEPVALTGTIWNVTELNGQPPLHTTTLSAVFSEDGSVGGSSGCNNFSAAYEVDGNNITLNMSPAAMTMMACPEPIMNQESDYMAALAAAVTFEINGAQMVLSDADGNPVVVFEAVSQDMGGTSWNVIGYNNGKEAVVSVIIDTEINLNFDVDGQLYGFAGCNHYAAPYEAADGSIAVGQIINTAAACVDPAGIMEQEEQYLAALASAATYTIDGDVMNMRTADGATAVNLQIIQVEEEPVEDAIENMLGNLEYSSEFTQAGTAPLVDGEYREASAADSAIEIVVMLTEYGAIGQINDLATIAVVLVTESGGSGTFYTLHLVQEIENETVEVAALPLGDRVMINSIAMGDNQIVVDMIQAGPDDPMCCPTQQVVNTYALQDGALVETSSEVIGTVESEAEATPDTAESSGVESAETAVSGTVTNIDNAPIPEGAIVSIQIQDTSLADAPATVIGEQVIENAGQFPFDYQVSYDPSVIVDNHTYTMSARITTADGALLFINDTAIQVITNDNPTEGVEIPVIEISG